MVNQHSIALLQNREDLCISILFISWTRYVRSDDNAIDFEGAEYHVQLSVHAHIFSLYLKFFVSVCAYSLLEWFYKFSPSPSSLGMTNLFISLHCECWSSVIDLFPAIVSTSSRSQIARGS